MRARSKCVFYFILFLTFWQLVAVRVKPQSHWEAQSQKPKQLPCYTLGPRSESEARASPALDFVLYSQCLKLTWSHFQNSIDPAATGGFCCCVKWWDLLVVVLLLLFFLLILGGEGFAKVKVGGRTTLAATWHLTSDLEPHWVVDFTTALRKRKKHKHLSHGCIIKNWIPDSHYGGTAISASGHLRYCSPITPKKHFTPIDRNR